jgi:DNA-binding response OmpR family regulator
MKKKILVADDDAAIVDAIQLILEDADYTVETTLNGEDVLKMEDNFPHLILLDIWMSGQDGRTICKYLKKQKLTRHIPIIMISANRDTSQIAKTAGADDFITKPFEIDELLKKVKKYVS